MNNVLQNEINHYLSKKTVYFKNFSQGLLDYLENLYPHQSLKAQWYLFKNNITDIPKCKFENCTNNAKFNEKKNEFDLGCSKSHNQKITFKKNYGVDHPNKNKKQLKKVKKSVFDKYGVDSVAKLESTQNKRRKTNKERYGTEEVGSSKVVRDKIKETNLERYGYESPMSNKDIRDKAKKTMMERYDTDCSLSSSEIRQKINKTNLEKYGTIFPMRVAELQKKRRNTIIGKYDAYGANANPEVLEKFKKTYWKNYYTKKLMNNKFVKPMFDLKDQNDTNNQSLTWLCKICGSIFQDNLDNGNLPQCINCFPKKEFTSNGKNDLFENILIENKRQSIHGLIDSEIDIFLPDFRIGINYNEMYWHSEQEGKGKYYHLDNTMMAENKEIFLIQIFEFEWITKKMQVLSYIKKEIGEYGNIIDVSEITIKTIDDVTLNNFLITNSLEPKDSKIRRRKGVFKNNELVAVMSTMVTKNKIEITRFSEKMGVTFNKNIFKILLNSFNFDKGLPIYYYVNRRYHRYADKNIIQLGFNFEGSTEPSLGYTKKSNEYITASKVTKSNIETYVLNYDENLTINENMVLNGYYTIWDCGKFVYKMMNL